MKIHYLVYSFENLFLSTNKNKKGVSYFKPKSKDMKMDIRYLVFSLETEREKKPCSLYEWHCVCDIIITKDC